MDGQLLAGHIASLEASSGKIVMILEQLEDEADLVEDFIRDIEHQRSLSNGHIVRDQSVLREFVMGITQRYVTTTFVKATMLSVM